MQRNQRCKTANDFLCLYKKCCKGCVIFFVHSSKLKIGFAMHICDLQILAGACIFFQILASVLQGYAKHSYSFLNLHMCMHEHTQIISQNSPHSNLHSRVAYPSMVIKEQLGIILILCWVNNMGKKCLLKKG